MADPVSLFVAPILTKVITSAMELCGEKINLLRGVKDEIQNLSEVLEEIKDVLHDAEEKQINNKRLKRWLKDLRDAAYDAEDVLDLFATKAFLREQERKVSKLKYLKRVVIQKKSEFKAAQKIKELSERFKKINKDRAEFNLQLQPQVVHIHTDGGIRLGDRTETETGSFVDESMVVGRKMDIEKIIKEILRAGDSNTTSENSENLTVISIVGMGGIGKTTLAQLVYNDPKISNCFEKIYKMWVYVSQQFDCARILKVMLKNQPNKVNDDLNLAQLQSQLEAFLTNNRFLLVLDDVWTEDSILWDELRGLLNKGAAGSIVLVTARSGKIAKITGSRLQYDLDQLTEEDSKQLFRKCAFIKDNTPDELKKIGDQIACKYSGLPLAIKAVAGLLRNNLDVSEWRRILRTNLWTEEEKNQELKVMKILRLSYDHLPSYLKPCFLFCSIFPKGHSFCKCELVKIWIAEGFILLEDGEKLEDIGSRYFEALHLRSFFDARRDKTYRMHDFNHDLAVSISKSLFGPDYIQVMGDKDESRKTGDELRDRTTRGVSKCIMAFCTQDESRKTKDTSRHVSVLCGDAAKPILDLISRSNKVRTVLRHGRSPSDFGSILDDLFQNLRYIRVLDLSSSSIDVLPDSIEELQLLRFLDLSKTKIKMLPNSICNLCNLQTLRLLRCLSLQELPKDLAKLTSLRHLELDDVFWYKLSRFPVNAGSLRNLHNLHKFWVRPKKGYGIEELEHMTSLTGKLHLLTLENVANAKDAKLNEKKALLEVVFQWSDTDDGAPIDEKRHENTLNDLQPHSEVEELQIIHFRGSRFPAWITDGSLKKLTSVSLDNCINCKTLSIREFPHLTSLILKWMRELEELADLQHPSLEKLKVLVICGCPKLRALPGFFSSLRVLKIKKCNLLKVLPVAPYLTNLKLTDNANLDDLNEDDQSHYWLDVVKIIRCPMLKQLPETFNPQKLEISDCDQISPSPVKPLKHLRHLALDTSSDGSLLGLIRAAYSIHSLVISNISTISSLPIFPSLTGLKALYIRSCTDLKHLCQGQDSLQSLTSLKFLSIQNCPNLKDLPSSGLPPTLECLTIRSCPNLQNLGPNQMLKSLASLKDVSIQNCETLQSLPADGFPDSLQHLKIHGCPLISRRCFTENGDCPDWLMIRDIPDLEIDFARKASTTQSVTIVPHEASSSTAWFRCYGK